MKDSDIRILQMPSGSTTIDHREKDHYTHKDHSEKDSDIRIQQKDLDIRVPRMPSGSTIDHTFSMNIDR